jgi:thiol-disulfide isomerase/thioredoxin
MTNRLLWGALLCLTLSACNPSGPTDPRADLHGRWLLINYWAEWCKPCLEEMPELNAFQQRFSQQVKVTAVNFDGLRGEALRQQAAKLHIAIALLEDDPAAQLGYKRPEVLPSTYVFSPDGKLQQVLQGQQTQATLAAAIQPASAGAPQ